MPIRILNPLNAWRLSNDTMKVKEQYFSEIENNPILHEQYWLNEMFHSPVLPEPLEDIMSTEIIDVTPVKSLPLYRRTFTFDGIYGGQINISETPDFQNVKLNIQSADKCGIEILLNSQQFAELSYLKYSMQMQH